MEEMEASFLEKLKVQDKLTEEEEEVSLADPDKANEEANKLCANQTKGTYMQLYVISYMVVLVYSSFVQWAMMQKTDCLVGGKNKEDEVADNKTKQAQNKTSAGVVQWVIRRKLIQWMQTKRTMKSHVPRNQKLNLYMTTYGLLV